MGNLHAFRATPGQPMEDLGTLGGADSGAYAISGSGQVVGISHTATGASHAFRATPGQPMEDLGTLGGTSSYATNINAAGQVVGTSEAITPSGFQSHAFLYDNGVMVDIGKLAFDGNTFANDINDVGQVVGLHVVRWTGPPDEWFEGDAVLWTPISLLFSRLLDDVTGVGPGKSLAQKVRIATAYYDANDGPATCAMLRAFGNEVKAQSGKKKLSRDLAQQLMNDARTIRVAIGCKGG
jgi:probable HAF family extracellular repeat protein